MATNHSVLHAVFRYEFGDAIFSVDGDGRAVQTMRSVTYLQPGEQRGCVGCHESPSSVPRNPTHNLLAIQRAPSRIRPGPDGTLPLSYPRLVQNVLDRQCVSCHNSSANQNSFQPSLTGEPAGTFTASYNSLLPYVRWYEWGDRSIAQTVSLPGHCGSDASPLWNILADKNHAPHVKLSRDDRRKLNIWLDANAPFYGTYLEQAQTRQRAGDAVHPPDLQ